MKKAGILWIMCGLCLALPAAAQEMKILVPAYFYPGGEMRPAS